MSALIAIAALCQVASQCLPIKAVDQYQLKCQKELIACYEKSTNDVTDWQGKLKDCVKERQVK